MDENILTPEEAAKELGISLCVLGRMMAHETIPYRKFGNKTRFLADELETWLSDVLVVATVLWIKETNWHPNRDKDN